MYNIKALEEEWKRYRRKKIRPWVIAGSIISLSLVVGIYLYFNQGLLKNFTVNKDKNQSVNYINKYTKDNITTDKIQLAPMITTLTKKVTIPEIDSPIDVVLPSETIEEKPKEKLHIEVIDVQNKNSYKEVEKRFRLGHDPDDSLFLAKFYYKKGWYKKAEYWALQTNKINDNIEESWLIFAKAKAKRGKRNEAKRILNVYIKKTNSSEAKVLLDKIKKGRFK